MGGGGIVVGVRPCFGSLDVRRAVVPVRGRRLVASLFELDELCAHLRTRQRRVRLLSERYDRRCQGRSENDGGNEGFYHGEISSTGWKRSSLSSESAVAVW